MSGETSVPTKNHMRFLEPVHELSPVFGSDWFALKAEAFARFFGTPVFLMAQTIIVAIWIVINAAGWWLFDAYPFILLNLAFSLQAAYAAPLILLAQTRQADRDKARSEDADRAADAQRRHVEQQTGGLRDLLQANTELTERIAELTSGIHAATCKPSASPIAGTTGREVVVIDQDEDGRGVDALAGLSLHEGDAVVLCDHDAPDAPQVLRDALASPASYVAMMASRRRSEGLMAQLREEEVPGLEKLHVPAGLNIGGKAPGEIALSVVAEIVAESYGRPGGPMRG